MNELLMKLLSIEGVEIKLRKSSNGYFYADIDDGWIKEGIALRGILASGRCPSEAINELVNAIKGKSLVLNPTSETGRKEIFIFS